MKSGPYLSVPYEEADDAAHDISHRPSSASVVVQPTSRSDFDAVHADVLFNENYDPWTSHNIANGDMQMKEMVPTTTETLMVDPDSGAIIPVLELEDSDRRDPQPAGSSPLPSSTVSELNFNSVFVVVLLFFINLINYIDRYTTAGVLKEIIDYYHISNKSAGLLQTVFIVAYMFLAPVFGYCGDRYNRIVILVIGISFWSGMTLLGSFVPRHLFWAFVVVRGLVGVGEASYSTVAPTIIADLFSNQLRTNMLTAFYFAIPVGSGLGYIIGSHVKDAFGSWQWALRVTPALGLISVILLLFFVRDPPRGASDGGRHLHASSSWSKDIAALARNKSYMLSTWGLTAVSFVAGALAYWTPHLTRLAYESRGEESNDVSVIFGAITVASGITGVISGAEWAKRWKRRGNQAADPIVCAIGLLICAPFMLSAILIAEHQVVVFWVLIAIAEVFLCLNWAVVADILFYVVIPTRRSTAEAFQILVSHLFGDAGSPYLIGVMSDSLKNKTENTVHSDFISLQNSLYSTVLVCVLGGVLFLFTSSHIVADRKRADELTKLNELGVMEAAEEKEQCYPIEALAKEAPDQKEFLLLPKSNPRVLELRNESRCSTGTTSSMESSSSSAVTQV